MTSAIRWIWVACGIAGAVVVALVASLVASLAAVPETTGSTPATVPAEPFAIGTPVTVPVGKGPRTVVPTPDGRRVLVLTQAGVVVVDAPSNTVLGTIALGSGFGGLVLAPGGERAYMRSTEGIEPIDLTTGLIGDVLVADADGVPTSLETISPDGTRLFGPVHDTEPGLGVVDLASGTARLIPLPSTVAPDGAVVTTDGRRAYVADVSYGPNGTTQSLRAIDVATGSVTEVAGTEGTLSVTLSRDGKSVYGIGFSQAVVLDAATGAVTRSVPTSLLSGEFVASHNGRYLCVVDVTGNGVEVFDMDSGGIVAAVPIGAQPLALALAPDDSALYVVSDAGLTVVPVTGGS